MLIEKGWANSLTVASPEANRSTMARRVGSARAEETAPTAWSASRVPVP